VLTARSKQIEGKPLVLLQVNCRSILNKILEFCNLIDTFNPDVIISTELWLREETNNAEVFRDDYTTFRRDRSTGVGGVCICVKNYIDSRELWTNDEFEMMAVEVKGRDPKFTWEILGIYRAPNDNMRVMERLAARTAYTGHSTKRSIIGGDLNLPCVDWNGKAGCNNGTQAYINSLV
jgi:exonuclease III